MRLGESSSRKEMSVKMKSNLLSAVLGTACLAIGIVAGLAHGGTLDEIQALGHSLVIAGAIIIGAGLVSSAIRQSTRKD